MTRRKKTPEQKERECISQEGFHKEIGEIIKARREVLGLGQKYVADKLDITVGSYSHLECSRRKLTLYDFMRICKILDLHILTHKAIE